jgi:predicted RND superfamily exporter protein
VSGFEFSVTMGLQMVTVVLSALACDLLLLPALLAALKPPVLEPPGQPSAEGVAIG